jgi:SDR family mycofactocin-dependent oxidoreductase
MGRMTGKVAFITGAGQGQGRAHAIRLAEEGADIIATDACRRIDPRITYTLPTEADLNETRALVQKAGGRCVTAVADVRSRADLQAAVRTGVAEFGYIDTVVANAGVITFHSRSIDIDEDAYDLILDVNLKGVFNTIVTTAPAVIAAGRPGSIIVTSSAAGLRGQVGYAHYTASKHGGVGLARAFANELAKHRIRVNSIHPTAVSSPGMGLGTLDTDLFSDPLAAQTKNILPDMTAATGDETETILFIPPSEISEAVLWLASDESRYVTGVQLPVDAGMSNRP